MLSPNKKSLIIGFIKRNIARGYLDLADNQIYAHIDDFTEDECIELQALLQDKIDELTPVETEEIELPTEEITNTEGAAE